MLVLLLLLTGCSKDTDDKKVDKNTGKEQLVVAMDCDTPPYTYLYDQQNDNTVAFGASLYASGYDVLVARDLAKSMNKELVIKKMSREHMSKALEKGEVDLAMGGLLKGDTKGITYSSTYYPSSLVFVVAKDSKLATMSQTSDLQKKDKGKMYVLGSVEGAYSEAAMKNIKGVKQPKPVASYPLLLQGLLHHTYDVIAVEQHVAELMVKQNDNLMIPSLKKPITNERGVVIAMKSDNEMKQNINTFIKKRKQDVNKRDMDAANASAPAILAKSK